MVNHLFINLKIEFSVYIYFTVCNKYCINGNEMNGCDEFIFDAKLVLYAKSPCHSHDENRAALRSSHYPFKTRQENKQSLPMNIYQLLLML